MKKRVVLGDDSPKKDPSEDHLNYIPFAERIAKIITSLSDTSLLASNGYVIGLHGQWGSGKSTVINFVLYYLRKYNAEHQDKEIIHIEFQPLIVSGHQDLIAAFFKTLSEKLDTKDNKCCLRFFKRMDSDSLARTAEIMALMVDPTGGTPIVVKSSFKALLNYFRKTPSLQSTYENLQMRLRKSEKRFLVTIDDIDRLEGDEIRVIMKMVKSIGQLPNLVYLLSYDREIVWDALDEKVSRTPRFAEKIVQLEVDIPRPSQGDLLTVLKKEIDFLNVDIFNTRICGDLLEHGINRWIKSPRDVVRFSNAVKTSWLYMKGKIDPHDLLAIEGIRLFDRKVFYWLRDNGDFLFNQVWNEELKTEVLKRLKVSVPSEVVRWSVIQILITIFPDQKDLSSREIEKFSKIPNITAYRDEPKNGLRKKDVYDMYFGSYLSSDDYHEGLDE